MSTVFELPAEVNIYCAAEMRDALQVWSIAQISEGAEYLAVSAKAVSEIDGSGLQLLAALGNAEHRWHLVDASTAFSEACRTLGFGAWLEKPVLNARTAKAATP